ncbi:MAG: RNA-dependent ATPase [Icmadophila ericetorum]|nr:RNA-dependent ATPase [Icmadophila ericetorum]
MAKRSLEDGRHTLDSDQQIDSHKEKKVKKRKTKASAEAVNSHQKPLGEDLIPIGSTVDKVIDHEPDFIPLGDAGNDLTSTKSQKRVGRARTKALKKAEAIGAVPNDKVVSPETDGQPASHSTNEAGQNGDVTSGVLNCGDEKNAVKKSKKDKKAKEEKEEKESKKRKHKDLEDSASNGMVLVTNGEASGSSGDKLRYSENPTLSALPESEIDSFLSSNFIDIVDPKSTKFSRPIISFSHLPPPPSGGSYLFGSFKSPTPIQAASWPFLLSGRDVVGVAETGSGKTLAYGLPCIRYVCSLPSSSKKSKSAKAIIVSPTRELAQQIYDQMILLATPAKLKVVCVYGGVPKDPQREALKTAHIVVATPGRLKDLMDEGSVTLNEAGYLVLDEADRMLDKGFEDDIRKIISYTPSLANGRQTLMFTATWPPSVRKLASTFMQSPVKIVVGEDNPTGDLRANTRIVQKIEVVESHPRTKEARLLQLLKQYQSGKSRNDRILVFCLYKKEAARVEQFLRDKGMRVVGIHGDLSQEKRTGALEAFKKEGGVPLMVATDVAARGLDIPAVKVVINVTFPLTVEDYVHRIGRTGRAGAEGLAITLFTEYDKAQSGALINVLKAAGQPVPDELLKFGTTVKKKGHEAYGAFYKDTGDMKAASKIKFDD